MTEEDPKKTKPIHKHHLIKGLIKNILIGACIIAFCLGVGMMGYHHFEKMDWVDAYANAAMILSGMGPVKAMETTGGKLFAGTYALFSGIVFLFICGVIFLPLVHYFLEKFHIQQK